MRHTLRCALAVALLSIALGTSVAAAPRVECRSQAIVQLKEAPDGLAVYRQIEDKAFFTGWLDCADAQFALPTAVHESVHHITADTDAFPLVGGGQVARPHAVSRFYAPSLIARKFPRNDFVDTYLKPGEASSASDFLYLLDELNAYSHDLNAAVDLAGMTKDGETEDHRDGLAALMAFVTVYVETAQASQPDTWRGLQEPEVAKTVSTLWSHAEAVMTSSCGIPNFGTDDRMFIRQFCRPQAQSALGKILGRAPTCPTACLRETLDMAQDGDGVDRGTTTGTISRRVPADYASAARRLFGIPR